MRLQYANQVSTSGDTEMNTITITITLCQKTNNSVSKDDQSVWDDMYYKQDCDVASIIKSVHTYPLHGLAILVKVSMENGNKSEHPLFAH